MFRTRVLLQAAVKRSTGIVGLEVVPNARDRLKEVYAETLQKVQVFHEGVPYRDSVEAITKHRLDVVTKFEDADTIEKEIDCGQLEELLEQARDELELIDYLKDSPINQPPKEE